MVIMLTLNPSSEKWELRRRYYTSVPRMTRANVLRIIDGTCHPHLDGYINLEMFHNHSEYITESYLYRLGCIQIKIDG